MCGLGDETRGDDGGMRKNEGRGDKAAMGVHFGDGLGVAGGLVTESLICDMKGNSDELGLSSIASAIAEGPGDLGEHGSDDGNIRSGPGLVEHWSLTTIPRPSFPNIGNCF